MTTFNNAGNNAAHLNRLNEEFAQGYTLRIVSAWSRVDLVNMTSADAAYELRSLVTDDVGDKPATKGANGLSSYECYIALWDSLGDQWPLEVLRSLHSEEVAQDLWESALVRHEREALKAA